MKPIRIGLFLLCCAMLTDGYAKDKAKKVEPVPAAEAKPVRIFLLSGQSNMVGHGSKEPVTALRPDLLLPRNDVWTVGASLPAKPLQGGGEGNLGIDLTFGNVLGDKLDEPVLLLKAAWDGTSLWVDFRPPSAVAKRGGEIGGRYTEMMSTYARVLQNLDLYMPELAGRKFEISGFVWFQGEADANRGTKEVWAEYEANMKDLIHDIRTSFGVPEMPAVIIQINNGNAGGWHLVREAQKKVAEDDPRADWVLTLDQHPALHYDSQSYLNIGERCGQKMLALVNQKVQDHSGNPAIKALIQKYILDKIKPPMAEAPDMKALCKGLYGYFPFDGPEIEVDGKRKREFIRGAGVQPVEGSIESFAKSQRRQDSWVEGVQGKALRLRGQNLVHFRDFKEPVDERGMLGDMTVSFWIKANSIKGRRIRLGRGVGYRLPTGGANWYKSWEANYAGWDFTPVGSHGEVAFTTCFERVGARGFRTYGVNSTGVLWTHVVMIFDKQTGEKSIWLNGKKVGQPDDGRKVKPLNHSDFKGLGIVEAANAPLSLSVQFESDTDFACFDELCMWNRVLTSDEIRILYNNAHGIALPKE
jgi:hypothetical protein